MPKISLFGKKLNIGGDDFVVPGLLEAFLRATGLVFNINKVLHPYQMTHF